MVKKHLHIIIILAISILICSFEFFFKSWTYFLLDSFYFPINEFRNNFFETTIFWFLNDLFNIIFWYKLFSKIVFFFIIFFAWILWYLFSWKIIEMFWFNKKKYKILSLSSSLFLMINPFFYERMITQPLVYLSIILVWYWLYFLITNLENNKIRNSIFAWIFFGFSITISQHTSFMILLIFLWYLIFFVRHFSDFKKLFLVGWVIIFVNLNWLIWWFFLSWSYANDTISTFTQENIDNFYTNSLWNLWVEFTNLLLYWFWGERYKYFYLPWNINSWYVTAWTIILTIIIFWWIKIFIKNKKIFSFLFFIWISSFIFWLWTISKSFGFISEFLYNNVPFYMWLREPQKWIWILMLSYAFFFSAWIIGFFWLLEKNLNIAKHKYFVFMFTFIVFLFLNAWSPSVIFWFQKQLFISDYPTSYFDFKEKYINHDWKSILLPWHSYMWCNYTKWRVVANVAWEFLYPMDIIVSDNIEIWSLYTNSTSQVSKDIEEFLKTHDYTLLKKHNILNIIFLSSCADYKNYNFLEHTNFIKKIYDSTDLKFYRIE